MISANLSTIFYLISGILFILALRGLSSPDTSRQGNYFRNCWHDNCNCSNIFISQKFSSSLIHIIIFLLLGGAIGAFLAFESQ